MLKNEISFSNKKTSTNSIKSFKTYDKIRNSQRNSWKSHHREEEYIQNLNTHVDICGISLIKSLFLQAPHRWAGSKSPNRNDNSRAHVHYWNMVFCDSLNHWNALLLWNDPPRDHSIRLVQFSHAIDEDDATASYRLSYQSPTWRETKNH